MHRWLSIVSVGLGVLAIAACGGSGSDGGTRGGGGVALDCSTLNPAPDDCDKPCNSDSECTASFCENNTKCVAHCTATEGCGENATCNARGRCVPNIATGGTGGGGNTNGCQSVTITPTRSIPNVMFLVDQSGSMPWGLEGDWDPDPGEPSRWEAAHSAITGVVSEIDSIVRFGLTTYQSAGGGSTPDECPIFDTQIDFAMDNFGTINMSYEAQFPGGRDTPTGDSIDVLVDAIRSAPPPPTGPTIIVLATDGDPDSCENPNPNPTAQAQIEAVNAAARANGFAIDVFVLWVGALDNTDTEAHLQAVANAGVGNGASDLNAPFWVASGPDAPFWVGDSPLGLETAFRNIIADSISCEIQMDRRFDDVAKACAEGDVRLNGNPLDCPSEWRVKPGVDDVIELVDDEQADDDACDTLKSGDVTFSAVFPCGAIVVE